MNKSIKFLDQIIEKAKLDDVEHRKEMIRTHKASHAVGESWMVFHLKILKEMLEKKDGKN